MSDQKKVGQSAQDFQDRVVQEILSVVHAGPRHISGKYTANSFAASISRGLRSWGQFRKKYVFCKKNINKKKNQICPHEKSLGS